MNENKNIATKVSTSDTTSGGDEYVLRRGVITTDKNFFKIKHNKHGEMQWTFGNNNIIIPVATLEAIRDYIKDSKGKNMKKMIGERALEYLASIESDAFSNEGYNRGNNSCIKIVDCGEISEEIKKIKDLSLYDRRVLQVCVERATALNEKDKKVVLITSNISMRYHVTKLAKELGLRIVAKEYQDDMYPEPAKQYKGLLHVEANFEYVNGLNDQRKTSYENVKDYQKYEWYENMFVVVKSPQSSSALAVYKKKFLHPFNPSSYAMSNIFPRNKEQKFFMYAFMQSTDNCSVIIARGPAGTGKTLIALAGALENLDSRVVSRLIREYKAEEDTPDNPKGKNSANNSAKKPTGTETSQNDISKLKLGKPDGEFNSIILTTPMVTVSNEDLGALPGDKDEKVSPYYGGVMDNLAKIIHQLNPEFTPLQIEVTIKKLFGARIIEIIPIAYMRGRSFENKCVLLDEAQNVEPDDILDIVSRLGENSRLVITGDPQQVNKVGLSKKCNGIVYATEGLKGFYGGYVITFIEGEIQRSPLAKFAVQNLL